MEKLLIKVLILVFCVLMAGEIQAQNMKPTTWELKFSRSQWKDNDTVTLYFIGKIPDHQSVYATNFYCDLGPMPSKLVFTNAGNDYVTLDSAISVGEKQEYDPIFECSPKKFKGQAVIKQKLRVSNKEVEIKGQFEYQTCTDEMCLQFYVYFETKGSQVLKVENGK